MGKKEYEPTQEQIEKECERIRKEWDETKWNQQPFQKKRWTTPEVKTPALKIGIKE